MKYSPAPYLKGGLAALVFFLGLAWLTPLDMMAAQAAWSPFLPHWPLGDLQPWKFLYQFGQPPALIAGLLGLLGFGLSFTGKKFKPWRGPGLYLFVVLVLGPGLLVNTLGKGLCGRPRPMELVKFLGNWNFLRPLELGIPGSGRSFLSGHAAAAFYWFALFFLRRAGIFRGRAGDSIGRAGTRPAPTNLWDGLDYALFWGVVALGALMGTARILQGGHFISDVTLCGAGIYLVCALCSPLIHWQPGPAFFSRPWVRPAMAAFVLSWLFVSRPVYEERYYVFQPRQVTGLLEARPYERVYDYPPVEPESANLALTLERGDIRVTFNGERYIQDKPGSLPLGVAERFQGLAVLWGKVELSGRPLENSGPWPLKATDVAFSFEQKLIGFFFSSRAEYTVILPREMLAEARLKTGEGRITIAPLPEGRRTAVFGQVATRGLPAGFSPEGVANGHLKEGADPLLQLVLDAPTVIFE